MNLKLIVLALLVSLNATSAAPRSELEIGMAHYQAGEFKQAVAHFQFALKANPHDAESYYWIGLSYQGLADLAVPFSSRTAAVTLVTVKEAQRLFILGDCTTRIHKLGQPCAAAGTRLVGASWRLVRGRRLATSTVPML